MIEPDDFILEGDENDVILHFSDKLKDAITKAYYVYKFDFYKLQEDILKETEPFMNKWNTAETKDAIKYHLAAMVYDKYPVLNGINF